jgi:hypothetical protein
VNERQLRRLFPNASRSTIAANADHTGQDAESEQDHRESELALSRKPETKGAERVHLRIVSVRKRLCDPDNLVPKWTIDCLRYCRIIRGDEPDKITLETTQRKTAKGEAEHTLVQIFTALTEAQ